MTFQQGKIVNIAQGSEAWAKLRAERFTASEAPAMMGKSKYQSRSQLLKQKATGLVPEVSEHQQRIFDKGHQAEAAARVIAEREIGEDLFPVVLDDEQGGYLASMDGLTMLGDIGWEHKLINEALIKQIEAERLDEHYMIQLDQQFALSGADKILFTASDGTEENCRHLWIERDESRFKPIEAGWEQFAKDLADYEAPEAEQPKAEGKAPDALPALNIQATGEITASNLQDFEQHARKVIAAIKTDLITDQDFADAEQTVKFCKKAEERLSASKDAVLAQTASIDEVFRTIDSVSEDLRQTRLKLEKAVKAQKESRKAEIVLTARKALDDYIQALRDQHGIVMPVIDADFPGVIKGKKNLGSMQSAVDDEMARAKIEADQAASLIRGNLAQVNEQAADYKFLFNDFGQICMKPAEDFAAIVKSRIADHKEAEQKRMDAEREKIRQEEEAKAKQAAEEDARGAQEAEARSHGVSPSSQGKKSASITQSKGAHPARPSTDEIIQVLASHYGVDTGTAALWIHELKIQEAA
ncbi:MAG: YqaJ viral recombinase family protein [Marinobacter sp.]|uniref:YqaJ viral recombinase family protein n=1 Tax=Marinobacter sp. TaxID=50741 RepID=UPI003C4B0E07